MIEVPPLQSIAHAALAVGVLFLVRMGLALWRLRRGRGEAFSLGDIALLHQPNAFGEGTEPDRRYALRQMVTGVVLLLIGAGLLLWRLAGL